jgi:hypothetical protein
VRKSKTFLYQINQRTIAISLNSKQTGNVFDYDAPHTPTHHSGCADAQASPGGLLS